MQSQEFVHALNPDDEYSPQVMEQVRLYLGILRPPAAGEGAAAMGEPGFEFVRELLEAGAPRIMATNLSRFAFEARREVSMLIVSLILFRDGDAQPGIEYLEADPSVLSAMVLGYESDDSNVALICGVMLRELLQQPSIAETMLHSPALLSLFDCLLSPSFDVSSDAFDTFKGLLTNTGNKPIVAEFFEESYDVFFGACHKVFGSDHFFSRLQLMKLLGELLFDRSNFHVMKRYISEAENLKLVMRLLKDPSNKIVCEALNVFKIFVANPDKAPAVSEILLKNQAKLLSFLKGIQPDDAGNQQFLQELSKVIEAISKMQ